MSQSEQGDHGSFKSIGGGDLFWGKCAHGCLASMFSGEVANVIVCDRCLTRHYLWQGQLTPVPDLFLDLCRSGCVVSSAYTDSVGTVRCVKCYKLYLRNNLEPPV